LPAEAAVVGADQSARGRAVAALVAAASELFAARGPDAVSLREIAARAELNYGLIHQYVGSKDDLLRLVIADSTARTAARFAEADGVDEALELLQGPVGSDRPYPRLLAWAILQGRDPAELAGPAPALPRLIEMLPRPEGTGDLMDDPRVRAAAIAALTLGWSLFGAFVLKAAELDDVPPDEAQAAVQSLARQIARI
jgi:TetR/AcrR family transcriptional regulator, repressor for neighboring sulfatase